MRRFLVDEGYHHEAVYGTEQLGNSFLQQDVKLGFGLGNGCSTGKKVKRGGGSKPSWMSESSGRERGSEESVFSWGLDVTKDTGAWMEDMGYADVERGQVYEYPMVMSGVTECAGGFEDGMG